MKSFLRIFVVALLFVPPALRAADAPKTTTVAAQKVRLFVLSGQSNMQGVNPGGSFTPVVKQAFPDDDVIVVHYAEGGTPIRRWWKGWTGPHDASAVGAEKPPGDLYDALMARVKTALAGKTPEKVATQDPRGAWVDSDDLNGEKNDLHCTKEGFAELGRRFAAKAVELLGKPSVSPVKP